MRLKLQFWKTPNHISCCLLDHEGLPEITNRYVEVKTDKTELKLLVNTIVLGVYGNCGEIASTRCHDCGDNQRKMIDYYVDNITRELFPSRKREVKVGDIVTLYSDNNTYYEVLDILPEKYYNRYIIATTDYSEYDKPVVFAQPTVTLANKTPLFIKETTGNVETYTWEI